MNFSPINLRNFANQSGQFTPNAFGVSPGSSRYADLTMAALSRRQFDEWVQFGLPALQQQAGLIGSEAYANQQRGAAREAVSLGMAGVGARRDRALRSFGAPMTAEEQGIAAKGDRLTLAGADVDAYNRATQQVQDREFLSLSGVSGTNWRPQQ